MSSHRAKMKLKTKEKAKEKDKLSKKTTREEEEVLGPRKKAKTMSLSDQLLELTTPAPKTVADPEDQAWEGRVTFDYEAELEEAPSKVATAKLKRAPAKARMVAPVEEIAAPAYQGKRISRKALQVSSEEEDEEEKDEDELAQEEELERREKAREKMAAMMEEDDEEEEAGEDEEEDEVMGSDRSLSVDSIDDMRSDEEDDEDRMDLEESEEEETKGGKKSLSLTNQDKEAAQKELQKALEVKEQFGLWDNMLQLRVALQEPLQASRRFPLPSEFPTFLDSSNPKAEALSTALGKGKDALRGLLKDLRSLQSSLPIPSIDDSSSPSFTPTPTFEGNEDAWEDISLAYEGLEPSLRQVLDKWHMRTLYSGATTGSQFKALNKSVTAQVDEMLQGPTAQKLIARSQPVPTERILGQPEPTNPPAEPEIFDDGEFYNLILKDLIQAGSTTAGPQNNDPIAMSREYLRLRRLRKKQQKKAREHASSKGRKIKYEPMEKLVAFMAPQPQRYPDYDSTRTTLLFQSLLGVARPAKSSEGEAGQHGKEIDLS